MKEERRKPERMLHWGGRREDNREGKRGSINNIKGVKIILKPIIL